MFNAYAQVTAALDRAVTGLPAGRSKAVYAKNCHAIVPCTDEAYANDIAARCREAYGMGAMAWLRDQRMAQARLLRSGGMPVAEVARRTGYRSPSALTAALRRANP